MTELIERLEAACEGSRELDAAMFRAIGAPLPDKFANLNLELTWGPDGSAYMPVGEMQVRYDPPAYTLSIDAIVAIIERKLPGWHIQVERHPDFCDATLWPSPDAPYWLTHAATMPMALCASFLRALQAQQETSEDE